MVLVRAFMRMYPTRVRVDVCDIGPPFFQFFFWKLFIQESIVPRLVYFVVLQNPEWDFPKAWVEFFKTLVGPKPFVRFSNPGSFLCLPLSLCIYWLNDKPRDSYYNYLVIVLLQYIVTYCPFHKTLSSSSSFLNWILVRFYEMDCIKISWYCLISLPPLIPFSGTKRNPPSPLLLVVKLIISTNLAVSYWIFTSSRV